MKLKMILRKYGLNALIILAEVVCIILNFLYLTDLTRFLWIAAFVVNFIAYLWILNLDTNPEFKIPWISIVLLIQPLGSLFYVMFSERKLTHREEKHMIKLKNVLPVSDKKTDKISGNDGDTALATGKAKAILNDDPQAELFSETDSEYFGLGEDMYEKMLEDLEQAENFIFLEYFIVEEGVMWNQILEILKKKTANGVDIDGQIGYTGGINLADEYINSIQKYGGKNVFLNLINQAKSFLYITTPYLIIDYDLTNAIQNAAKRGVDVKIITPYIPDKKIIQLMTRSSYPSLLESGVKIYEYTPGFIHAKNVIADDEYAVAGTINFDYRSLVHHYENAVWMYKTAVIPSMKTDFLNTMEKSTKIEQSATKMNVIQKVLKYCIRIFAPLM